MGGVSVCVVGDDVGGLRGRDCQRTIFKGVNH